MLHIDDAAAHITLLICKGAKKKYSWKYKHFAFFLYTSNNIWLVVDNL